MLNTGSSISDKDGFLSSVVIDSETLKISVPYTGTGLYIAQNL